MAMLFDKDSFYTQRDSRAGLEHPLAQLSPRHIAIAVPPEPLVSGVGIEIALFWTASIIRRMGRPFAELILVSSDEFRRSESRLAKTPGISVERFISSELLGADPFGSFEWRVWAEAKDLSDAAAVVWLGTRPLGVRHNCTLAINANGWISVLQEQPGIELSLNPPDFDAAPAAIIFASCMAAARIFSAAFNSHEAPGQLAFALDSGYASTDPAVFGKWLSVGGSLSTIVPWKASKEPEPHLGQLLVVSAGGIGGNFCSIVGGSYLRIERAYVVEPENFDISNLNRAIGISTDMAIGGMSKAEFAAGVLSPSVQTAISVQTSYESWVEPELIAQFREQDTAVAIGVDQMRTRLTVGSDWPWMLLNGATSGTTFSTSIHVRPDHGCIGCWYGQNDAPFVATRTPMACAAGAAAGIIELRPVSSYPFVSVAAAAQMVALLVRAAYQNKQWDQYAGTVSSMSLRFPENAQVRRIEINKRCLLLCAEDYLQSPLQRSSEGYA
jgi:hypothetical protein